MQDHTFATLPVEELFGQYQSSPEGLTSTQAAPLLKQQQRAARTETRFSKELKLLLRQFTSPLVLLLVIAVILSGFLGETSDTLIILGILLATGLISFWQELNAGRSVEKLKALISIRNTVLRDSKPVDLLTTAIVPGDIILLKAGDIIPADCRLLESNELHVNESALTGESYPAEKMTGVLPAATALARLSNCIWQGTNVISGTAKAMVIHTGGETIFGSMADSLNTQPETAFEQGMKHFGYFLLQLTIVLCLVILSVNLWFKKTLLDAVLFSLALAVGMAPELLPAIMSFAMSAGAKRMMQKKVIVKKLSSIFSFGEVNVLCTDKTGTITEGELHVADIVDPQGQSNERLRQLVYLNSSLQQGFGNPVDEAVTRLALPVTGYRKTDELPYDFTRKRLSIAVQEGEQYLIITKGAVPNVLDVCDQVQSSTDVHPLDGNWKQQINERFENYCGDGLRVLGIAVKNITTSIISRDDEQEMVFAGFLLLEETMKATAASSISRLKDMQISTRIITGDNRFAALHAAKQLGLTDPVILTGPEMGELSPEAFAIRAKQTDVFAETEPHQKVRIVSALQRVGLVVAYMGDGINDVAAIHAADTGISASNAVDVAKEAADFVLLEKDLSVLADGILEGRKSFINSMKYIFISTGATFGNMFSVAAASLLLPFLPMLPKQILLTNFITDFPCLAIASDEADDEQLKQPQRWDLKMIRNFMIVFGVHSSLFDLITFYVLYYQFRLTGAPFRTGWFLESVITELLILLIIRTRRPFLKSRPGKWLLTASIVSLVFTIWLPFSPLASELGFSIAHGQQVLAIGLILILYVFTAEWLKKLFFKYVYTLPA